MTESMNFKHEMLFTKLENVLKEMNSLAEVDAEFEDLLCTLNHDQTFFNTSLDDMVATLTHFLNEQCNSKEIRYAGGKAILVWNGTVIEDIFMDETGRFTVNPLTHYNLTKEELTSLI